MRQTRPDTRNKMRLVCVLFTFENNTGHTDLRTDGQMDMTSYRDVTAHLKTHVMKEVGMSQTELISLKKVETE